MAEAPRLTIRHDWPRPDAALVEAFRGLQTGWVADAQGRRGALDHGIRPLTPAASFVGAALPVWAGARDNLAPYAALPFARPGDVLVVATDDHATVAVMGDVSVGLARNAGVVAVVTDGMLRDLPGVVAVGIPVFGRGLTPNSPEKDGPGTVGLSVVLGGVAVGPGDLLVGDGDGVVVVPFSTIGNVLEALRGVAEKEAAMEAMVAAGAKAPAWLEARLAREDVRFV